MLKKFISGAIAISTILGGAIAATAQSTAPGVAPPLEAQLVPKARIALQSDRVNMTLINKTNAAISYQVIGDTNIRTLGGQQTVTLQGLRVPVTLTLDRQDFGLLQVTPKQSQTSPNTVEATLETTTDLGIDATTLRVERTGSVFLY